MHGLKCYWWIGILLLVGIVVVIFWLRRDNTTPSPSPTPIAINESPPIDSAPLSTTFASQLHFTFTVPSGWSVRQWKSEEMRISRGDVRPAKVQLGEQLDTFLAAVQDDSHIWVAQPVNNSQSTERLTVLALPRHWLRLEQVAAALSDTPSAQLIDTSLRMDGAPVLVLDSTHLRQQRDPARKFTLALMFHPSRDQFVMLIQSSPASVTENRAFLQNVIQSILFE